MNTMENKNFSNTDNIGNKSKNSHNFNTLLFIIMWIVPIIIAALDINPSIRNGIWAFWIFIVVPISIAICTSIKEKKEEQDKWN